MCVCVFVVCVRLYGKELLGGGATVQRRLEYGEEELLPLLPLLSSLLLLCRAYSHSRTVKTGLADI